MEETKLDDFTALVLVKSFYNGFLAEWERYRDLAANHPKSSETIKYFDRLFPDGFQQYFLLKGTELYRARIIKRRDWKDTGIAKKQIDKELYSIILSQEEIDGVHINELYISPENLAYLKMYNQGGITAEQQGKIEGLLKKYSEPNFYGFSESGCGVPPKRCRQNYRLSKKNDAYLYSSLERETAIQEMRPIIGQSYNMGVGTTMRDLRLANLRDEELYNRLDQGFEISSILSKISEPNTDVDERFYHITQLLSKYVKKQGFDGIIYKSALKQEGSNILLFNPKAVQFVASEVVSINEMNSVYTFLYPCHEECVSDSIP